MGTIHNCYNTAVDNADDDIDSEVVEKSKQRCRSDVNFSKKMRSYCREYCNYTGIHGFKYFGERRSLSEKICWIIIFGISLIICIGVIYKTFLKWKNSPVIVNIATEEQYIYNIPFPAVTICHEVKISRTYFNYSHHLKMLADGDDMTPDEIKKLQYMSLLCGDGKLYIDKIPKIDLIDEDFYRFLEKGVASFFNKCRWMGKDHKCFEIFQPVLTDEGLCMTFNMMNMDDLLQNVSDIPKINYNSDQYKPQKSTDWEIDEGYSIDADVDTFPRRALLSGSNNALVVNMNVSMDEVDYGCTSFQGFQVVLHKAERYPTVQQHYFRVPLSKSVIVAITPLQIFTSEKVKSYSADKRKCLYQGEKTLKYFKHYTQFNCRLECLSEYTMKKCGCVAFYMPRQNNTPVCGNGKYECLKKAKDALDMLGLKQSINRENNKDYKLECNCLPMCSNVDYNVEITEIDFDWYKEYESVTAINVKDEKFSSSQLVIYFKSNHFIPYERNELYGPLDFLANVGGLLGLFIGFSLLSFFEVIYFLTIRIVCNLRLYKQWYGMERKCDC